MNILVIGSSIIDLFLQIEHEENHVIVKDNQAAFHLGDKIPTDITKLAVGGNGANVSVGLSRLGIPTTFYTYLGRDIYSYEISETLKKEGVELLTENSGETKTSMSIILKLSDDRVIFSNHSHRVHGFSYINQIKPDFAYITSIGEPWEHAYEKASQYFTKDAIPYAFAPGSHQMQKKGKAFDEVLKKAHVLFVNREEAQSIVGNSQESVDIKTLLLSLQQLGPQIISVTDGKNGAYCLDDKQNLFTIEPISVEGKTIEKTGAGDAYASGFLASYMVKKSVDTAMAWGLVNAYYSMLKIGAHDGLVRLANMDKYLQEHMPTAHTL